MKAKLLAIGSPARHRLGGRDGSDDKGRRGFAAGCWSGRDRDGLSPRQSGSPLVPTLERPSSSKPGRCRSTLPSSAGGLLRIPPPAIAQVPNPLDRAVDRMPRSDLRSEMDQRRTLRPIDWVEPAIIGPDWHLMLPSNLRAPDSLCHTVRTARVTRSRREF